MDDSNTAYHLCLQPPMLKQISNIRFASFGVNDTRYAYTTMVSNGAYFSSGNINITFNDDYNWVDDRLFNYTAVHEIGHSLGLSHTTVEEAVMYPYFDGYIRPIHPDDKMGIHGIYGWKNPQVEWHRLEFGHGFNYPSHITVRHSH